MIATKGEKVFYGINYIILTLLGIIALLPFLHVISVSFSSNTAVISGQVKFWPVKFTIDTYKFVIRDAQFLQSLKISIFVTVTGTILSVLFTFLTAYPLSKKDLIGREKIMIFFIITMLFSGGLVPTYLLIKGLGLYNTVWALFIPSLLSVYNMLLVKNYLETLPSSLEESAKIDGANSLQILRHIIFPLAVPVLATVSLFYAVGLWNSYFPGLMYISSPSLKPLQTYLFELVKLSQMPTKDINVDQALKISSASVQTATIVAATFPILLVYPFLQKYFVKGLVVGSVKG